MPQDFVIPTPERSAESLVIPTRERSETGGICFLLGTLQPRNSTKKSTAAL
jgi:hypothetical protein